MKFVSSLRVLWRYRLIAAIGVAVALPLGILASYSVKGGFPPTFESRQYNVGVASSAILVDSKNSQVVDAGGGATRPDVAALSVRARLLANLMAASPLKDQIATRARVRPDWLIAHPPAEGGPVADRTPEGPSATIRADDRRASVLQLHVNESVPIITAEVRAPDAATAARIATASIAELERYLQTATGSAPVPDARKLVVSPLGAARSATELEGRGLLFGVGLALALSVLWCGAIVGMSSVVRAWRQSPAEEVIAEEEVPRPAPVASEFGVTDAWARAGQPASPRPNRPKRRKPEPPAPAPRTTADRDDLARPEAPARVQDLQRPEAPLRRVDREPPQSRAAASSVRAFNGDGTSDSPNRRERKAG